MSSTSTTGTEAKQAIAQLFAQVWEPTGFRFALANEIFDPPTQPDETWARFITNINASGQDTLGPPGCRKFERQGSAFIQTFVPEKGGELASSQLTDRILAGFEGVRIPDTTVCFRDIIPREVGISGKWYQVTIEAEFEYTEIK